MCLLIQKRRNAERMRDREQKQYPAREVRKREKEIKRKNKREKDIRKQKRE